MKRQLKYPRAIDARTMLNTSPVVTSIFEYFIKLITGQCQRYTEYEIKPMNTSGRIESSLETSVSPNALDPITVAAPRQGIKALTPGKPEFLDR